MLYAVSVKIPGGISIVVMLQLPLSDAKLIITTKNSDWDRPGVLKFTAALKKHKITLAAKECNLTTLLVCLACFKCRYLSGDISYFICNLKLIPTTYI